MAVEYVNKPTAPPRTSKAAQTAAKKASGKRQEREDAANGIGQLAAFGAIIVGYHADAGAIMKYGPGIAHELANIAENNAGMARSLDYLTEVGPYAGLITVTLPLVAQILANHNIAKAEHLAGLGVVHPDALAAKVKTDLARQAAQAMAEQRAAETELAEMQQYHEENVAYDAAHPDDGMRENGSEPAGARMGAQ
jgi:hypothetical protein